MKRPLLWILLLSGSLRGQSPNCSDYPCGIAKVKRLLAQPQKDYQRIIEDLDAAEAYRVADAATQKREVQALRRQTFLALEADRKRARGGATSPTPKSPMPSKSSRRLPR